MPTGRRPWTEELAIIDRTMRAISGITDPEELVDVYWSGIGELIHIGDYVALSRRDVAPPEFLVTRYSRFTEHLNPWTQRDRLPRHAGGLLGEIVYGNAPMIIDDLPTRLTPDDPGRAYLDGFQSLVALPQYDRGESLNVTCMLLPAGFEFDKTMIPMMHWQSGLFGRGTQNLVLRNRLAEALGALDRELQAVGDIQKSLLPQELPKIDGFEVAASYTTSARAGGDYYDFFPLVGGGCGMFIADVSGHGTPAAVLMAITHAIAHSKPGTHKPPAALLTHLNTQLTKSYTNSGTFITAFYAVLDPAARKLTYSAAGHNPPRLVRRGKVMSLDRAASLPLGILGDQVYGEESVQLERGDLVLLYTDGISEAMGPRTNGGSPELFGVHRLDRSLIESVTAADAIERVKADVDVFTRGAPATDDRTVIAVKCV